MKKHIIDPEKWYTLTDLVEQKLFPWCGEDIRNYRKMVLADKNSDNILRTVVVGRGKGSRYQFKGSSVIKFINSFEAGTVRL